MSDGWHDDPFGRYSKRYHDGTNWTVYVSNGGVTEQDPMGTQPSPPGSLPTAPPIGSMPTTAGPEKGNAILRFLARIIDGIIISIPLLLVFGSAFDDMVSYQTDVQGDIVWDTLEWNFPFGALVIQVLVFAAYEIFMVGNFGRTIGKMVVGVTVVRAADGGKVDYGIATVRYIATLMYVIPLIGFILFVVTAVKGFSDRKGQTLHDSIAKTMVARSSSLGRG
jgi:uncharacterized RDD family membrane protein YckC